MTIGTTVLGYPRIGPRRELKRAVERYWSGRTDEATLRRTARELRDALDFAREPLAGLSDAERTVLRDLLRRMLGEAD